MTEPGDREAAVPWLRATYPRLRLERGSLPQWVQGQFRHAAMNLTANIYGEWTDEATAAGRS